MTCKPILYAEDDENDTFLMERAFQKLQMPYPLRTVSNGNEVVAYLEGTEPFDSREKNPLPCLVLLDLSMPGRRGLDVLQWIRAQPGFAALPVVVFTSSNQETDIARAKVSGANGYIVKPGDPDELLRIVERMKSYWLTEYRPPNGFVDASTMGL